MERIQNGFDVLFDLLDLLPKEFQLLQNESDVLGRGLLHPVGNREGQGLQDFLGLDPMFFEHVLYRTESNSPSACRGRNEGPQGHQYGRIETEFEAKQLWEVAPARS